MLNEEALRMVGPSYEEVERDAKKLDTKVISIITRTFITQVTATISM